MRRGFVIGRVAALPLLICGLASATEQPIRLDLSDPWTGTPITPSSRLAVKLDHSEPWPEQPSTTAMREAVKLDPTEPWASSDEIEATPDADASVDAAMAHALRRASDAGQWDVVRDLARELEQRRKARAAQAGQRAAPETR